MLVNLPARLVCLGLSSAFLVSSPALASGPRPDITPDSANSARFGIEQQGKLLTDSGAYDQAAQLYWAKGIELADPVLIIDAAEAWRQLGASKRSIEAAQTAIDRVQLALDMLYFLRDSASSSAWQPVASAHLAVLIERAESVVTDAGSLIAEIEAEQLAATEPAPDPANNKRSRTPAKPGTGLIAGGSAAIVLGLGGAGLGITGLVLGGHAQRQVEDPTIYEPDHSAAEARGRTANVLAGVGIGVAAVGIGVGAALIAIGKKKREQARSSSAQVTPSLHFGRNGAGLGLQGRF